MGLSMLFAGFDWIAFTCIVIGLILVVIEMHIPGFGAPGITGIILLAVGVILYAQSPLQALILVVIILAVLGVALTLVLHSASKGHLSKHLVLNSALGDGAGFSDVGDLSYFVGSEGKTLTVLRPSGMADFSGVKLDVVSEGEFIPKGSIIVISKVEGNRIVVKLKQQAMSTFENHVCN